MAATEINDYISQVELKLRQSFSDNQRIVLIAALAERHLAKDEDSSRETGEKTGLLREAVEAVWEHVQGHPISAVELERLQRQVLESGISGSAPILINLAVQACATKDNTLLTKQAVLADYEAALHPFPGYPEELHARKEAWRQPDVQAAIERQEAYFMHARALVMNMHTVNFLKREARSDKPTQVVSSFFTLPTRPSLILESGAGLPEVDPMNTAKSGPTGDILRNLASMLGRLQQADPLSELRKWAAAGNPGMVSSKIEKEHAQRLETTMRPWKNERRIVFCAALAERWFSEYLTFAAKEGWGEPDLLRESLDAVWDHLLGNRLKPARAKRFSQQIIENTPDTENFDAPLAMAACEILDRSLDCCLEKDNLDSAVSSGLAACSSLAMLGQGLDYRGDDPDEEERLWEQPAVRQEIERQSGLLSKIAQINTLDEKAIKGLQNWA